MNNHHFLVICLPAQGHLNPTLQLAKNIALTGARATFTTTVFGLNQLKSNARPSINGLSYASFSDGYDDGGSYKKPGYLAELKVVGSKNLTKLLEKLSSDGCPVTFLVYTLLLPWVAEVARENHLPSALVAIQSAASFSIYHHFFNGNDGIYSSNKTYEPSVSLELPGLPPLTCNDIPSFLLPTSPHHSFISTMQEHIQTLEKDPNPCVLANTFDALEENSIKYIASNLRFIPIGPLILFGAESCDLFESGETDYISWLDSKPNQSVIYVSFGSLVVLQKRQKEELLDGLVRSGRPFLWVLRDHGKTEEETEDLQGKTENGLIVNWCAQREVLRHRAIGCFLTHCGWNSVLESVVSGVALVGCPQFSDQMTNAKMVEVWGIGVRADGDGEGVVGKEEIERCLGIVMGEGEKAEEIRNNVVKLKGLAMKALEEGGSSSCNLKVFLDAL